MNEESVPVVPAAVEPGPARPALVRLTVNLTPRASLALELATALSGDSKTDTVNRAIQMYAWFEHERVKGSELIIREPGGGQSKVSWF